ncbi:MAG: hypothetical protein HQK50_18085 [Oligoflexia bacterium]|nr:hypothetical protein [Oligoflexia bacterium]
MGFLEAFVAVGVLGTASLVGLHAVNKVYKSKGDLDTVILIETTVDSLYRNVRANIALYKIDFKPENENTFLKLQKYDDVATMGFTFPLVFDRTGMKNRESCSYCTNFLAYNIHPYVDNNGLIIRGLFLLTIKLIHPAVVDNEQKPKLLIYNFLIRGQ